MEVEVWALTRSLVEENNWGAWSPINNNHKCTKKIIIINFQTLYITKSSQLNYNVIDYKLEIPDRRKETTNPLSSPKLPF